MHQKLYPISVKDHAAYIKCEMHDQEKNPGAKPQSVPALLLRFQKTRTSLWKGLSHDFYELQKQVENENQLHEKFCQQNSEKCDES